jgi:hypothetical protein
MQFWELAISILASTVFIIIDDIFVILQRRRLEPGLQCRESTATINLLTAHESNLIYYLQ